VISGGFTGPSILARQTVEELSFADAVISLHPLMALDRQDPLVYSHHS